MSDQHLKRLSASADFRRNVVEKECVYEGFNPILTLQY